MTDREDPVPAPTRRSVLLGAGAMGAAALAAGALAACGSSADGKGSATTNSPKIKVGDIPVGGGVIYPDQVVVVTQPVAGQFKAFSAVCMHLACVVTKVDKGKIICPCHGSEYNIADGQVFTGPSVTPLTPRNVTVTGDIITVS